MGTTVKINIARDFSRLPAGRFRSDGPYSGERFRDDWLRKPLTAGSAVEVVFDGARGYGSSFLEEAFGGLVRERILSSPSDVERLRLVSEDDPSIATEVRGYITRQFERLDG